MSSRYSFDAWDTVVRELSSRIDVLTAQRDYAREHVSQLDREPWKAGDSQERQRRDLVDLVDALRAAWGDDNGV